MIWREMPPLAALRAFSSFAQAGSVTEAGAALNVSHAAISQQIRQLEAHMGLSLVLRDGRQLRLTEDGARLADALALGFGAIFAAVQELSQRQSARPVHVSLTASFASSWLMPRLPAFQARHPDIDLVLDPTPKLVPLEPGGVEVALRYGTGPWPGLHSEPLLSVTLAVVAAPGVVPEHQRDDLEALARLPWLEELGTSETSRRLLQLGVEARPTGRRLQMPGNLMLDAARDGQGLAVVVREFVESDIRAGRLEVLLRDDSPAGYHVVTRPGALRPPVRAFTAWLRAEAARA